MALTKTIKIDDDILVILRNYLTVTESSPGQFVGILSCGQLDRKTYERLNKVLDTLGGKWNRKAGGHIFTIDPRPMYQEVINNGTVTVTKEGWFPTPEAIIERMVRMIGGYYHWQDKVILEPSAGTGAIADFLNRLEIPKYNIYCVEKNPHRAEMLNIKGYPTWNQDFLSLSVAELRPALFDLVIMNPPFEEGQDIAHVYHAYSMLRTGGKLVSVMSEGTFFKTDSEPVKFRQWLEELGGYWLDLPAGSFKESGTGVKARLITITRPQMKVVPVKVTQEQLSLF